MYRPSPLRSRPLTRKAWTVRLMQRSRPWRKPPPSCRSRTTSAGRTAQRTPATLPRGPNQPPMTVGWPKGAQAFTNGDLMLNVNAPGTWNGAWASTASVFVGTATQCTLPIPTRIPRLRSPSIAASVDHAPVPAGDAVEEGKASLSSLAVWPQSHPFALDEDLLAHGLENTVDGWPRWLIND